MLRVLCALTLLLLSPAAHAEKRAALVIGNSEYRHTRALPNPKNDAAAIAKLLGDMGFEVTSKTDLDHRGMMDAVRAFGRIAQNTAVALVYFAGHGLELGGENYLIPTDAKLAQHVDLDFEAVKLSLVLNTLGSARKLTLVILDSCRNNPLSDKMALGVGVTRSVSRGLERPPEPKGNVLIAYSAKHGTLALDGDGGPHSPYAEALLVHMAKPGVDVRLMFGRVRDAVVEATRKRPEPQEPHIYGSLGGEVFALVPEREPPPPPLTPPSSAEARQEFLVAVQSRSAAALEAFAKRNEGTVLADMARAEAQALRGRPAPPVDPPPKTSVPAADRAAGPLTAAEERALRAGDTYKECVTCPEMAVVPAGEFLMGSPDNEEGHYADEGPQHKVTIAKPFAVGKFEVTRDEFEAFVKATGHKVGGQCFLRTGNTWEAKAASFRNPGFEQTGRHPVVCVDWNDAQAYVAWLKKTTGKDYRLLSEAEWEYATRGVTVASVQPRYHFGNAAAE
ncbi:MAG: caspase family protein, partial [Hyphomicrobiaceae bacterium]